MTKGILPVSCAFLLLFYFSSCDSGASKNGFISTDSVTIAAGQALFEKNCSGCHNFRQDAIGPQLGGLTAEASVDWIQHFIKDPGKAIESGDQRASQLVKKYKVEMPSFAYLTDAEMNGIIAYLNTHKLPGRQELKGEGNALSNPIPEKIRWSGLVVGLQPVTRIPASGDSGRRPLARITKLAPEPKIGIPFIIDLRGKLYRLQKNKPELYMDISGLRPKFVNEPGLATGFGSFAFHPDFFKNGLFYTTHTEAAGSGKADFSYADSIKVAMQWVLTEWKTNNPRAFVFSGKSRELLRINMVSGAHGVQEISFNPLDRPGDKDYGLLYIGIGDGSSVQLGYPFLCHSKERVWGTILRIDPLGINSANGHYGIPQDNPFVRDQDPKALGEIYAYGFRNPHRITWSSSGKMLVSNIGQSNIESLDMILPGHDYGWPIREGSFVLNPERDINKVYALPSNDNVNKITYPVAEYDHDEGNAISGGYEYWGKSLPLLKGKFLFGDIPTGRLFYVDMSDLKQGKQALIKEWKISINGVQKALTELCGGGRVDLHFGRDSRGELYILTKSDGKVYKLESAVVKPTNSP